MGALGAAVVLAGKPLANHTTKTEVAPRSHGKLLEAVGGLRSIT